MKIITFIWKDVFTNRGKTKLKMRKKPKGRYLIQFFSVKD